MNKSQKLFIVILNYNGSKDTIYCIQSFAKLQYSDYELVIVDNASTDDSVKQIEETFPNITLIKTGKNVGYTGGNNVGIKYAMANKVEYVLIINNDTELLNPHFLKEMIEKMEEDLSIGIIGPKVLNPGGHVQDTILFTPTLLNCIKESLGLRLETKKPKDYSIQQQVETVSGVCWLIRRKVIEQIGLLDEDYFMYAEEQDYCYRAQKAGWGIMYYPIESILHYKESIDKNVGRTRRQYIYARRNIVLFLRKHFGVLQASILAALFLISNALKVTFSKLPGKERSFYSVSILSELFHEIKYVLDDKRKN